jgi:hypothetical protein
MMLENKPRRTRIKQKLKATEGSSPQSSGPRRGHQMGERRGTKRIAQGRAAAAMVVFWADRETTRRFVYWFHWHVTFLLVKFCILKTSYYKIELASWLAWIENFLFGFGIDVKSLQSTIGHKTTPSWQKKSTLLCWTYLHAGSSYFHFHKANLFIIYACIMPLGLESIDVNCMGDGMIIVSINRLYFTLRAIAKYRPYEFIYKSMCKPNKSISALKPMTIGQ